MSINPWPVGGANGFWLLKSIYFEFEGETVKNLFNKELIFEVGRALFDRFKYALLVKAGNETEVNNGLPPTYKSQLDKEGKLKEVRLVIYRIVRELQLIKLLGGVKFIIP